MGMMNIMMTGGVRLWCLSLQDEIWGFREFEEWGESACQNWSSRIDLKGTKLRV